MSIATRFVSSTARPRLDLKGCVFYAPLWRPDLGGATSFTTIGDNGIPTHLCTVTGATWGYQGRTFDGVDDNIDCGGNTVLDITEAITMWAWVKRTATGAAHYIAGKANSQTGLGYAMHINALNEFRFVNEGVADYNSLFQPTVNVLYHLAVTYDRVNVIFYVNGVVERTVAATAALTSSAQNFFIGQQAGNAPRYFEGLIGEVGTVNRAFSAQGMLQNYQVTKWRYQ